MNISISGSLGSGKSTVCKILNERGFELVSAGQIFRKTAERMKITINELNRLAEDDESYDRMVDISIREKGCLAEFTIFDSRMAWYFLPNSFKVFLYLDTDIAAERVFNGEKRVAEDYKTVEEAKEALVLRANREKKRYEDMYEVDIYDMSNYDLVIDVAGKTPDEVIDELMARYRGYQFEQKKCRLYYWYIDDNKRLHGNVTHRDDFFDGEIIHTTSVQKLEYDEESQTIIFETKNSTYFASLRYWDRDKQNEYKAIYHAFPELEDIKNVKVENVEFPSIDPGNVLVRFANFNEAMFNSMYCVRNVGEEPVNYIAAPHIGNFSDSFIIFTKDFKIDLRYYWDFGIRKFYRLECDGMPLWFENVGDRAIFIGMRGSEEIILRPGERKLIDKDKYIE